VVEARRLTNLYNERSTGLIHAHDQLDRAVDATSGCRYRCDDEEAPGRLLDLRLSRERT
jgi:hypothetical protein